MTNSSPKLNSSTTAATKPFTSSSSPAVKSHAKGGRPKGKSKYAQKARSKPQKPVTKPVGPVNTYTSVCCGVPATKPPCAKASKVKGAVPPSLGSWRCPACRKACKVTVSKFKAAEPVAVAVPLAS